MYLTLPVLDAAQLAECRRIAAEAEFIDGRMSNPHNTAKQNLQLHDPAHYERSAQILQQALIQNEAFGNFVLPAAMAPPMMTKYGPGMRYGVHTDNAFLQLPKRTIRSDVSCTIFLSEPETYRGGALRVWLGDAKLEFKLPAGHAILYPSDRLHEVEEVTEGERLVAITFIQSRIADPFQRNIVYELGEVAALEGLKMSGENYTKLWWLKQSLQRYWGSN